MSDVSAGIEPIYSKYYTRRMQTPAGVIMGTYYINREDIKIDVARLNKKYKDYLKEDTESLLIRYKKTKCEEIREFFLLFYDFFLVKKGRF